MAIPELRNIDPTRGERTPDNTVLYDIVEEIKVINTWIDKIYEDADSRSFTGAIKSIARMIEVAEDLKRNLRVIQAELNRPAREQAAISRAQKEEFRKQRWEAKQRQREMNRQLWRSGKRHLFMSPAEYKAYKANQVAQVRDMQMRSNSSANPSQETSRSESNTSSSSELPVNVT